MFVVDEDEKDEDSPIVALTLAHEQAKLPADCYSHSDLSQSHSNDEPNGADKMHKRPRTCSPSYPNIKDNQDTSRSYTEKGSTAITQILPTAQENATKKSFLASSISPRAHYLDQERLTQLTPLPTSEFEGMFHKNSADSKDICNHSQSVLGNSNRLPLFCLLSEGNAAVQETRDAEINSKKDKEDTVEPLHNTMLGLLQDQARTTRDCLLEPTDNTTVSKNSPVDPTTNLPPLHGAYNAYSRFSPPHSKKTRHISQPSGTSVSEKIAKRTHTDADQHLYLSSSYPSPGMVASTFQSLSMMNDVTHPTHPLTLTSMTPPLLSGLRTHLSHLPRLPSMPQSAPPPTSSLPPSPLPHTPTSPPITFKPSISSPTHHISQGIHTSLPSPSTPISLPITSKKSSTPPRYTEPFPTKSTDLANASIVFSTSHISSHGGDETLVNSPSLTHHYEAINHTEQEKYYSATRRKQPPPKSLTDSVQITEWEEHKKEQNKRYQLAHRRKRNQKLLNFEMENDKLRKKLEEAEFQIAALQGENNALRSQLAGGPHTRYGSSGPGQGAVIGVEPLGCDHCTSTSASMTVIDPYTGHVYADSSIRGVHLPSFRPGATKNGDESLNVTSATSPCTQLETLSRKDKIDLSKTNVSSMRVCPSDQNEYEIAAVENSNENDNNREMFVKISEKGMNGSNLRQECEGTLPVLGSNLMLGQSKPMDNDRENDSALGLYTVQHVTERHDE